MIEYETLTSQQHEEFEKNMALMDTQVFEDLYYFLHGTSGAREGYHADGVLSPRAESHSEYFNVYHVNAKELCRMWYPLLENLGNGDAYHVLVCAQRRIQRAIDMIELTWAMMQLRKVVSLYLKKQKVA